MVRLRGRIVAQLLMLAGLTTALTMTMGLGAYCGTHYWPIHETMDRMPPTARGVDDLGFISVIALVSATLGGAAGVALARGVGRPIAAGAKVAAQASADDRPARVDEASAADDVALLIDGFNRMAAANAFHERERAVLTAGIAHALRTPLTVLKGRLHGLADGVIDPATGEADRLLRQVSHLSRLVEDLLTLSHANAGALGLDYRDQIRVGG